MEINYSRLLYIDCKHLQFSDPLSRTRPDGKYDMSSTDLTSGRYLGTTCTKLQLPQYTLDATRFPSNVPLVLKEIDLQMDLSMQDTGVIGTSQICLVVSHRVSRFVGQIRKSRPGGWRQ
jgi:hypothetical protein